jgi:phosphatidylinositol 3,5-bisphosphate 5-phosphatase
MATYRKINEWKNHSRDVVESFKRYYHNSFLDSQRQEAFNLFLGNYTYSQNQPMLWDLPSDYYLHHSDPRYFHTFKPRNYINWFTPAHLEPRVLPNYEGIPKLDLKMPNATDEYWLEYYRPLAITTFAKTFAYKISLRPRYLPEVGGQDVPANPSPFVPRNIHSNEPTDQSSHKKQAKLHVMIIEPSILSTVDTPVPLETDYSKQEPGAANGTSNPKLSDGLTASSTVQLLPSDRSQWSIKQWYDNLRDPTVTEEDEYVKYVAYPLNQPLVTGTEEIDLIRNRDFVTYMARGESDDHAASHLATLEDLEKEEDGVFEDIDPESLADYAEFLAVMQDAEPLTVTDEDEVKKRYKAYRQWLKGRSFFKLSKLDPEWRFQNG